MDAAYISQRRLHILLTSGLASVTKGLRGLRDSTLPRCGCCRKVSSTLAFYVLRQPRGCRGISILNEIHPCMIPFGIHVWFGYYADNCLIAYPLGCEKAAMISFIKIIFIVKNHTLWHHGRLRKISMESIQEWLVIFHSESLYATTTEISPSLCVHRSVSTYFSDCFFPSDQARST